MKCIVDVRRTRFGRLASALAAQPATASSQAWAQDTAPPLTILGQEIPTPVRIEQMITWDQVKDYVPQELQTAPDRPLSRNQVREAVDERLMIAGNEYAAALNAFVDDYMAAHPEETRDREIVELYFAQEFLAGAGEALSPEIQKLAKVYTALGFLSDALSPP